MAPHRIPELDRGGAAAEPVVSHPAASRHRYGRSWRSTTSRSTSRAGIMVGLIGPDGVGKSTLLALIAGVAEDAGRATVDVLGGDIADVRHRRAVGPRIAYMPQGLGKNLYPSSASSRTSTSSAGCSACRAPERRAAIDELLDGHRASRRSADRPGRQAVGRHEAEARPVLRADPRPGPADPRRADHRRRSAVAPAVLGADRRHPRRPAGDERAGLHRLHGGGRSASTGWSRWTPGTVLATGTPAELMAAHRHARPGGGASSRCCPRRSARGHTELVDPAARRPARRRSPSRPRPDPALRRLHRRRPRQLRDRARRDLRLPRLERLRQDRRR